MTNSRLVMEVTTWAIVARSMNVTLTEASLEVSGYRRQKVRQNRLFLQPET
jgi:ABC-type enterochelin transport system permease subunit